MIGGIQKSFSDTDLRHYGAFFAFHVP
jgi:hypothetical protein